MKQNVAYNNTTISVLDYECFLLPMWSLRFVADMCCYAVSNTLVT